MFDDAPILMGTTSFSRRVDTSNILITGGAGFMYEVLQAHSDDARLANHSFSPEALRGSQDI